MSLGRRLLLSASGSGGFAPPPAPGDFTHDGPYDPLFTPSVTVLTQLHCHTTQSDGSYSPAAVVADYLAKGYDALQITDHDKITSQPAGITTAISGNEYSPTAQHIIGIDTTFLRGAETGAQAILDGIAADGGYAQIAHPKWYRGMTSAEMAALTDYLGFEIHNAKCVNGAGQNPVTYPGYAIDRWDELLTSSRRDLWGFAVDDLHTIDTYNDLDIGRLHVFAATNTAAGVVARLVTGDFVADVSNYGVTPGYPDRSDEGVSLTCSGATRMEAWGGGGALLSSVAGDAISWAWTGAEHYVRLVAIGDYTEPFSSALSDRWRAVDGTWTVAGGVLAVSTDATARRIILRRHREGDFTASVDVKLSAGGTDAAALMFNVLSGTRYYIIRIGESSASGYNNRFAIGYTVNGSFTSPLASSAFDPAADTWYSIAMDYAASSGTIRAKVWERGTTEPDWMLTVADTHWRHGAFGFRANRTCEFDNLYVNGFRTYYQPIAIDPV